MNRHDVDSPIDHHTAAYTEGWQGDVYRWLAKHIDRQARKLRYPSTRRGVRMWLEDVADALVSKAIRRGWKPQPVTQGVGRIVEVRERPPLVIEEDE